MVKVSVITAVFNRVGTIAQALASVRSQSWPQIEHIVIDGGSTDGTLEVLRAHAADLAAWVSEPDGGLYDALNKGLARATGDVIGFLHADDVYATPDALAHVARAFEDPQVDAVYGDLVYTRKDDATRVVRYWRAGGFTPGQMGRGWMPPHPTFYARRSVYERLGGFDTRLRISADYDSLWRFLGNGGVRPAYVPQVLVRMRLGGASNASLRAVLRKSSEDLEVLRRHGLGGLAGWHALVRKNVVKLPQFVARVPDGQA